MAQLVRQTGQLARVTRISQHPVVWRRIPTTWISPRPPWTYTPLVSSPRFYSTKKPDGPPTGSPKRSDDEGEKPKQSQDAAPKSDSEANADAFEEGVRERWPLPDGWVYLTDEEINLLKSLATGMPRFQKTVFDDIERIKLLGVPEELRKLLLATVDKSLTLGDVARIVRVATQAAARYSDYEVKEGKENRRIARNMNGEQKRSNPDESNVHSQRGQSQEDQSGDKGPEENGGFWHRIRNARVTFMDVFMVVVAMLVVEPLFGSVLGRNNEKELTWQEIRRNYLDKGLVEKLTVFQDDKKVRVDLRKEANQGGQIFYFSIGSIDSFEKKLEQAQDELGIPGHERISVSYATASGFSRLFYAFGPTALLVGLTLYAMRGLSRGGGSQMFGISKSRAKRFNTDTAVRVKFADVAGMDEAKVEIMEFVSFLKTPQQFERLGAKIPRGAILSGPPGTGKTLLAKATAGESGVPFFSISGSEFVEMFVGVGPARVRDLFSTARKNAPCIIFIDEIDAIGRSRGDGRFSSGGTDEREATLNQILTEMDGFNTAEQVVVLAGTNRADVLDKALLRPGRFDRHIYIDRPTMDGRKQIFKVHLKKIVTNEDIEHLVGRLASLTPGFSGADIANVVNEAALVAARANADSVTMTFFEQAIERVVGGLERKSLRLNPEERKTVAYHEAGHAICGWFLEFADPLLKVSIIPRGKGALGYAQYLPQDAYLMTRRQLMDRMAMTLGGRVSEELHFPSVTTGASDDFKKVSQMARAMVTQWGMSDKVGTQYFESDPNTFQKPFAEATAQAIDAEVTGIVKEAYKECHDLLAAHKGEIGLVAEELLSKEVLSRDDLVRLLGPRQWGYNSEFEQYFGGGKSAPPPPPTENDGPAPAAGPTVAAFRG